jgi:hypothetical protein
MQTIDERMQVPSLARRQTRERITLNDSPFDMMIKMSEGNPGAITALAELAKNDPMGMNGVMLILHLDDMGMRGSQIWVAYKDHCKQDIAAFIKAIEDRDPAMVATVNASRGVGDVQPAVTNGASFR